MRLVWVTSLFGLALASLSDAGPSHAGALSGGADEREHMAVFGFVRDHRGAPVEGAVVTADFKAMKVKLVARSDVTGAFAIPAFDETGEATELGVTISIACTKDGFRFVREIPRHIHPKPGQPAEIDCVLARE